MYKFFHVLVTIFQEEVVQNCHRIVAPRESSSGSCSFIQPAVWEDRAIVQDSWQPVPDFRNIEIIIIFYGFLQL
jgi:hypothetical protein